MNNTYLLIDLMMIIGPLIISIASSSGMRKHIIKMFPGIIIVGTIFIIWDIFATLSGHWSFAKDLTLAFRFIVLPLEELLFFIIVPYACLTIYFFYHSRLRDKKISLKRSTVIVLAALSAVLGILALPKGYTSVVLIANAIALLLIEYLYPSVFRSRNFWLAIITSYIPFLIFNGMLTAIPVVSYSQLHILNFRVTTIPIEDFLYSFVLIAPNIAFFDFFLKKTASKN